MGNKFVSVPPLVPETIWQKMGNGFSSISTTSKVFIIGCFGYVIWRGFFGCCPRCDLNSKLLNAFQQESRQSGVRILMKRKQDYILKVDHINKVIACLPSNSLDVSRLKVDLEEWHDYILTIDSQLEHFLDMHKEFLDRQNKSSVVVPRLTVVDEPYTDSLDNLTLRLLSQESLENVFWNNTSRKKKYLLNKLLDRLKAACPAVTESELRLSVAYVYNKQKRCVSAEWLNEIEKEIKTTLDKELRKDCEEEKICSICLYEIVHERADTNCNHSFHAECIYMWIDTEDTCPVCRISPCYVRTVYSKNPPRSTDSKRRILLF